VKVLLFDAFSGGHHYEFASGLRAELRDRAPDVEVDVLFAAPTHEEDMFFDDGEVDHLYDTSPFPEAPGFVPEKDPLPAAARLLAKQVTNPRWGVVRDLLKYVDARDYDVVHVLELDKLTAYLWAQYGDNAPSLVGSINGVFYKPVESAVPPARPLRRALKTGAGPQFVRFAPPALHRGIDWNRWFLSRCLADGVVDHLTVPTEEARDDILSNFDSVSGGRSTAGAGIADLVSVVPDPTSGWADDGPTIRSAARAALDLPESGTQLLFFGRLCEENGIRTLFDALEHYEGPEFTMVFAGRPVAVSPADVEDVARRSAVDVVSRLEFIPQEKVETYFRAADGVLLPYERSFGACRPSNVFQKACMAGRPVIASDFGVLGRRVREWDLGLLCEPESADSLADTIGQFVQRDGEVHDPESMAAFAESQTFEPLAETVLDAYRRLAGDDDRVATTGDETVRGDGDGGDRGG